MTTFPTVPPQTALVPMVTTPDRHRPSRTAAIAVLIGGPLSFVFHVLWRIGHGPTVVNEHGVVLGLTNDQWSYLGGVWAVLLAVGVVATYRLHGGRFATVAGALTVAGLVLGAVASWVLVLYSVGMLMLYAGMLCLGLVVVRSTVLPRTSGIALLLAVAAFIPTPFAPDFMYVEIPTGLPFIVELQDPIMLSAAVAWTLLGRALLSRRALRPGSRDGEVV